MIDRLISDIAKRLAPSSGDDLLGFEIDTNLFFAKEDAFECVTCQRTQNQNELLRVRIELSESVNHLQDVAQALARGWTHIAYHRFQATEIAHFREATELRFVTVVGGDHFFVTGRVLAVGPKHESLVEDFERAFAGLARPIQRMNGGLPPWARGHLQMI